MFENLDVYQIAERITWCDKNIGRFENWKSRSDIGWDTIKHPRYYLELLPPPSLGIEFDRSEDVLAFKLRFL